MKVLNLWCVLIAGMLFNSCGTGKMMVSSVRPDEIRQLKLIEPFSYISFIEKGNRTEHNDSISMLSSALLVEVMDNLNGQIPLSDDVAAVGPETRSDLLQEMGILCASAERRKKGAEVALTSGIDSLVQGTGERFCLLILSTGFTRVKGNYGKQVAKGAALGLLTLGMYYQVPVKSNSTLYFIVADAQRHNVAFYKKHMYSEGDPLDKSVLTRQIRNIFKDYLL